MYIYTCVCEGERGGETDVYTYVYIFSYNIYKADISQIFSNER
jgi:hypothetical protein